MKVNFKNETIAPHLALIAVQLLFGTWPIFGKIVLRSLSSTSLVTARLTGAALAFALLQRKLSPLIRMPRKDLARLGICSFLGIVGNQFLYVNGLALTTVINTTLLSTTIPVFTLFVSIVAGHDKVSLRRLTGIALAAGGVIYLVNPARAEILAQTTVGNLLIVCNSLLYAAYIVFSKDLFERYGALNVITWLFVLGSIATIPVGVYSFSREPVPEIGVAVWLAIAFIIIFPAVGAYYLNAWALTKVSPSTVAIYIYLQPLIAFGFAPVLFGEKWNVRTLAAALMIFAGVGVVIRRGRSQAARDISEHPDALAH